MLIKAKTFTPNTFRNSHKQQHNLPYVTRDAHKARGNPTEDGMTREVRYMLFSNEELYKALTAALRAHNFELPMGFLRDLTIGTTGEPKIALTYVSDKGGDMTYRFENQEVLNALIAYCHHYHIPLPVKGAKTLEIKDGAIGLLSTLNFAADKLIPSDGRPSVGDDDSDSLKG